MDSDDDFRTWAVTATPRLFRQARLLEGDWHLAEDLVQETIARMYLCWNRMAEVTHPTAYALQTLYRVFASRRRLKSSNEIAVDVIPERVAGSTIDHDLRLDIAIALAELKPTERAVVVARYLDDLPVAEVAALLDRSEGWVRTTAYRALGRLRRHPQLVSLTTHIQRS
ncbi:MAG: SigE family RNA polymerase sigma factor [Arachnia sp.]